MESKRVIINKAFQAAGKAEDAFADLALKLEHAVKFADGISTENLADYIEIIEKGMAECREVMDNICEFKKRTAEEYQAFLSHILPLD